jgi:SpoVK/Ycf46/Vps4 family AAA+-type ATPase
MNHFQIPKNLGQGTPFKINSDDEYFDTTHSQEAIPIGRIFCKKFSTLPCVIHVQHTFTEELINFLRKKGELITDNVTIARPETRHLQAYDSFEINLYDSDSVRDGDYRGAFIYKDSIIRFEQKSSKKKDNETQEKKLKLFTISIFYHPGTKSPLEEFSQFLYEEKLESVIHAVFRDEHGGIRFEPFETNVPESFNVEKYYPEGFKDVHEAFLKSLNNKEAGLYLLHGAPGTGKTTYIKYLASQIDRDFIYIPVALIEALSHPSFLPVLLKKKHSVLVVEDAEKAILERDGGSSSSLVSSILNLTDGIMGNVFNISIIATYNSNRQDIDKALLRKGRLKGEYKFAKLPVKQAQRILDENNIVYKAKEDMTLADIFNVNEPDILFSEELKKEKKVGFF